jgi:4'-phosphopantetheinyl transferase
MFAPIATIERALMDLADIVGNVSVATAAVPHALTFVQQDDGAHLVGHERSLCHRLREPRRRAQFIAGRVAARRALGVFLGEPTAAGVPIGKGASGAPHVDGHGSLCVSISHSEDVAVAVVAPFPIGVDIELDAPRPDSFARLFFTSAERRRISLASDEERNTVINTLWTRKEAACKVGLWGGRLSFASLDCSEDAITAQGKLLDVRSTGAANYRISLATFHGRAAHG